LLMYVRLQVSGYGACATSMQHISKQCDMAKLHQT
jgi:hypothetical protein